MAKEDMTTKADVHISIIVPTYNEKGNIGILLEQIDKCLEDVKYEVVVVDDNSTDGTIEIIDSLIGRYPVELVVRTEVRGLASAVVEGFRHSKGDIIVVMDADLQHPPAKILDLIEEVYRGSDIVIASRHNGEFGNFSIVRSAISKGASVVAKVLFPKLSNIKDIQSGFFALKRDVINCANLNPTGYKILLEILILGKYTSIKEIGFKFGDREYGDSKLGTSTIIDYLYHVVSLSYRTGEINKLVKYSIVGISGIGVNMLVLFFFTDRFGLSYLLLSSAMAYEISILTNFIINDRWTFKSVNNESNFSTRALYFNYAMITGAILGMLLLYVFTSLLSINYLVSNLVSIIIVFIWRYYASITSVWKHKFDVEQKLDAKHKFDVEDMEHKFGAEHEPD